MDSETEREIVREIERSIDRLRRALQAAPGQRTLRRALALLWSAREEIETAPPAGAA